MKDGGSAFPVFESNHDGTDYACFERGLSLRDYFAGQALAGVIAKFNLYDGDRWDEAAIVISRAAYDMADAMLAEREVEK